MDTIPEIDASTAAARLAAGDTLFVDVRDPRSFAAAHVRGARHVNDDNLSAFLDGTERSRPLVVYCYHGHSSLGGAAYFLEQGFEQVWSLTGGFEAWRAQYPQECSRA